MRSPDSGSYTSTPKFYTYSPEIEYIKERPEFSLLHSGSTGDTFFDVGIERTVHYQIAQGSDDAVFAWSPGTALPTTMDTAEADKRVLAADRNKVWIGYANSNSSWPSNTVTPYTMEARTRPGVGYDSGTFYVGYLTASNIVLRSVVTGGPSLNATATIDFAHSLPATEGASVSVLSPSDFWICYPHDNRFKLRHYNGVGWSDYNLSTGIGVDPWQCTAFNVLAVGSGHVVYYQMSPGVSVACYVDDGVSEPFPVLGASDEYAYQSARITGVSSWGGRYYAVLERGLENSDERVDNWFSTLAFSDDGLVWSEFGGVSGIAIRGGLVKINGKIIVGGCDRAYVSDDVRLTGGSWSTMSNVAGWEYNCNGASKASNGNIMLSEGVRTAIPEIGDSIKRKITVNGAEFTLSLESVDRIPSVESSTSESGAISSRGPIKMAVDSISTIDRFYDSGYYRSFVFDERRLVSQDDSIWDLLDHDIMAVNDEQEGVAIATAAVPMYYGDFKIQARANGWSEDSGLIFWYQDESNYWGLRHKSGNVEGYKIANGAETVYFSSAVDGNWESYYMVTFVRGLLSFWISEGVTLAANDGKNKHSVKWYMISARNESFIADEKHLIGISGSAGSQFYNFMYHRHGWHWTVGELASFIANQCGLPCSVTDAISDLGPAWKSSYDGSATKLYGFDVRADVNCGAGQVTFKFLPTNDGASRDQETHVRLSTNLIELRATVSTGNIDTIASFPIPTAVNFDYDDEVRILICRGEDGTSSYLHVYRKKSLLWCTPMPFHLDTGYLDVSSDGWFRNLVAKNLAVPIYTYTWEYNSSGSDAISDLISSHAWILIENPDGSVSIVEDAANGSSLGAVDATIDSAADIPDDKLWSSIFKVNGAEVYANYVDPRTIVLGARVAEIDAPHIWNVIDCMNMGYKLANLSYSRTNMFEISGFLDPRLQLLDSLTVDGVTYVVEQYTYEVSSPREPSANMRVTLRKDV